MKKCEGEIKIRLRIFFVFLIQHVIIVINVINFSKQI